MSKCTSTFISLPEPKAVRRPSSTVSNIFSSEALSQLTLNVMGAKVSSNVHGHMAKMAAMPIYGKNRKNILFQNRIADDLETWYEASGTRVLPNSFK